MLWDTHKVALSEDFLPRGADRTDPQVLQPAVDSALREIENFLNVHNKSLEDFPPMPVPPALTQNSQPYLFEEELRFDPAEMRRRLVENSPLLTAEQRTIYEDVFEAISNSPGIIRRRTSNVFFVDAPGGCGKTFLTNLLLTAVRADRHIALAVASCDIAALLMENGKTAHSVFGIPVPCPEHSSCNIKVHLSYAQTMQLLI